MSDIKKLTVLLNDNDNVATALRDLDVGESTHNIKSINKIPKGHKISLKKIIFKQKERQLHTQE